MKAALSPVIGLVTAGTMLFMLSACAADGSLRTPASGESAPVAGTAPSEPRLIAEEHGEREAVIESVNSGQRTVTVRTAQGQTRTIQFPPNAEMARIQQGDTLVISVHQSLSARVLPPGSATLGATRKAESTPQQDDGGSWSRRLVLVNEITAIDLAAGTATVQGADQQPRTIEVKNPEMQDRLRSLQVGDLLELTFSEVFAARVKRGQ